MPFYLSQSGISLCIAHGDADSPPSEVGQELDF
jgi:hypothetical protein